MKIFATLWLMLATVSAFAQNAKVSGVVSDENGEPLMGAAVIVKGTTTGTTTGDGNALIVSSTLVAKYGRKKYCQRLELSSTQTKSS